MAKVNAELRKEMRECPNDTFDLIVRVEGDLQERSSEFSAMGVNVRRQFKLTNSLQIRCSGAQALQLARREWWLRADSDRQVKAIGR
ncbi:MAG: hypothetical protein ACYC6L_12085 [Anaerolineae bacterium]